MNIEQRIRRLERQNRALVLGCICLAFIAMLGMSSNDAPRDLVQAQQFQLVDSTGVVFGDWRMSAEGPQLVLYDEDSNERVSLHHQSGASTALFLKDEDGQPRVGTAFFAHGGGGFALHGPEGVGASVLYMQGTGPGRLSYYDSTGAETHRFPSSE